MTKGNPRQLKRNSPNRKCEECKEELEYLDEVENIVICPKCLDIYDLKIWSGKKK